MYTMLYASVFLSFKFYSISFLSVIIFDYVYCHGQPALMGDCPHWQPAIAVIIV